MQQTEAKVEALFDSFMSLREERNSTGLNDEDGANIFMFDDEDNYQASFILDNALSTAKAGGNRLSKKHIILRSVHPSNQDFTGHMLKG